MDDDLNQGGRGINNQLCEYPDIGIVILDC